MNGHKYNIFGCGYTKVTLDAFKETNVTLIESIGSHFDPEIVAAFFDAHDEIVAVYDAYKEI